MCADVILAPESTKHCVDGGVLEPMVMWVQHNFGSYGDILSSCRLVEWLTV